MIYRVVENRRKVIISSGTAKRRAYVVEQFFGRRCAGAVSVVRSAGAGPAGTGRLTVFTGWLTGNPVAVTEKTEALAAWGTTPPDGLLAVSGIARPEPFFLHARTLCPTASTLAYPDHHAFRPADLVHIDRALADLNGPRRRILTTEKDAARLLHAPGLTPAVRAALFVQPIDIRFLHDEASMFNDIIFRYVRDYQRNR